MNILHNSPIGNKLLRYLGIIQDPIVGIDIGSSAIKLLQLEKKEQQLLVTHYLVEHLPPGAVVEKTIKDPEAVIASLKKIISKSKLKNIVACISVPNAEAIVRIIQLDNDLTEKDIAAEIDLAADKYIPYSLDEVNLDFLILGKSAISEELIDVLLAVSKSENVNNRVDLLTQANINTKIVEIDSFAIERAFPLLANQLPEHKQNMLIAVIDIGATLTTINIFRNNTAIYTREQSFGGQYLLDEIQTRYGLTLEEAVLARQQNHLPEEYQTEVLQPFKATIVKQVNRALQFFFSSGEYHEINYLFLAGGTSNIPGLDEHIANEIGVKTAIANPFTNMLYAPTISENALIEDAPALLNCCGLALRNCLSP